MYLTDIDQYLELNSSVTASVSLDVVATWFNVNSQTKAESVESADYNITTTATTTIVGVPLSLSTRRIVQITVKNKGTATTTVTLRKVASGFTRELPAIELAQNESFVYNLDEAFVVFNAQGLEKT